MRILLVSDLHYSLKQLDWVVSVADDYDLVVPAGDHLDIRSYVEPDAQIVVVLEYLARIAAKTTVAACSGNHDLNVQQRFRRACRRVARCGAPSRRVRRRDRALRPTTCSSPSARGGTDRARATSSTPRSQRSRRRRRPTLDLGVPRAARRFADELDRKTPLRRHRLERVDRRYCPRSCCAGTCTSRRSPTRRLGRPHRHDWVVNAGREPGPVPPHIVIDTDRARDWSSSDGSTTCRSRRLSTPDRDRARTGIPTADPGCA